MSQTATVTTPADTISITSLSDEAILGIEPESSSASNGVDSQNASRAIEAEFASSGANDIRDEYRATPRGREESADAAPRDTDESPENRRSNRHDNNNQHDNNDEQRQPRENIKQDQQTKSPRDHNADRTPQSALPQQVLPLGSLQEFDAGFYSGDAASRTALAQSLFTSDPAAFRAMFDEAARLLGITAAPRGNNTDRIGHVAEASATADRFRPPALSAQNQDGGLKASATQSDRSSRDENVATMSEAAIRADRDAPNRVHDSSPQNDNASRDAANSARSDAPPAFPTESYRAFETSTNEAVARDVRTAITRTLEQVLPEGVAEGAAKRIGEDIFGEVGKLLAADAQLSSQVGEALRGWRFGSAEQQQVASLLSGRARHILPSVARRVIGEWTNSVLATARTRATRSEAAARRVDVGGAASGEAAGRGSARALRPREIDYARTSDDDIFSM